MPFPFYKQPDQMDCGPTCLLMVAKNFGRNIKLQTLRQLCEINREGLSLLGISEPRLVCIISPDKLNGVNL